MELWEEDLYELIGVEPEANQDVIKKAYKELAMELHPDRFPEDEEKRTEASARFGKITNAYNILKDEEERAEYDFARRMGFGSTGPPPPATRSAAPGTAKVSQDDPGVSEAKKSQAQNQYDQGKVYHKGKNWPKAIACYKEAVRLDATVADYHAHLGLAYLQQGLKTPANTSFAHAYKLDRKNRILKEHYDAPPEEGETTGKKGSAKPGLLDKLKAMFGGGAKKNAKGKKGGKKTAPLRKAGAKK